MFWVVYRMFDSFFFRATRCVLRPRNARLRCQGMTTTVHAAQDDERDSADLRLSTAWPGRRLQGCFRGVCCLVVVSPV